ncbi:DUF1877 domain-containing protein [Georgenia ruanii]|uniref:DUF1877 domain-containing protein n=1 Tax=Georgenia ruanii TaxID=348442 RepID=UPI0012647882|nr:DUF1877 domain-containing protein [Georgenia ruanii]
MGIRYYAYPLAPDVVADAVDEPRSFLSDDPLADAWGLGRPRRADMLYLDKCWRQLQRLTHPPDGAPRPAHALFAGNVTHTSEGWMPWTAVLTPAAVDEVARDLALLDASDVDALLAPDGGGTAGADDERRYVNHFLHEAQTFTARLQPRGWGLVYLIG